MTSPTPFCWIDAANWVLYDNAHVAELRRIDPSNIATLTPCFSLSQLEAYGEEVRREALGQCTMIVDAEVARLHDTLPLPQPDKAYHDGCYREAIEIFNAIRALARKEEA